MYYLDMGAVLAGGEEASGVYDHGFVTFKPSGFDCASTWAGVEGGGSRQLINTPS